MNLNIDFNNIKPYNGSQRDGFEELCCQLASFNSPQTNSTFIVKDGPGGDAGVECYWKLPNGSEHAWQAKYFPNTFGPSQWTQIDESVKTAIEKHPKIVKYYICIPKDRTDRRVVNKNRIEENSLQKEWEKHVEKWNRWCNDIGIKIEFEYWGAHELITMLTYNDVRYSGCALYWFNQIIFTQDTFQTNFLKARNTLADRYMPELDVELENIEKYFDAISLSDTWSNKLNELLKLCIDNSNSFHDKWKYSEINKPILVDIDKDFNSLIQHLKEFIIDKKYSKYKIQLNRLIDTLQSNLTTIMDWSHELKPEERESDEWQRISELSSKVYSYYRDIGDLKVFFKSKEFQLSQKSHMLLTGEAGIGKSHLLASIADKRVAQELPTLFFLGQHYNGGDPWNFILDSLDYRGYTASHIIGALSSVAKVKRTNALILIDAMNEGPYSDEWQNHLSNFITTINQFDNIRLIISCRSTFVKRLINIDYKQHSLIEIEHHGFKGFEHKAAAVYLDKQGIDRPSTPIMAPEFSNPLFLKLSCEALKLNGQTSFPKGLRGIRNLLKFYSDAKNKVISHKLNIDVSENIFTEIFNIFSQKLYEQELYGLKIKECIKLIDEVVSIYDKSAYDVLLLLLEEGILSEDILYSSDLNDNGIKIIRYTFERFSDYSIAEQIVENNFDVEHLDVTFNINNMFGKIFSQKYLEYRKAGIIEALSVIVPEQFKLELIDIVPKKIKKDNIILNSFEHSLLWRDSSAFTETTLKYLNKIRSYGFSHRPTHDIILKLSTEPKHPWNAELLHKNLIDKTMPERDEFWSIYVALNHYEEDEDQDESIIKTLIDWAWIGEIQNVEDERIRLCSIILIWFFSTSNRKVRDYALKALVSLLSKKPHLIEGLLYKFVNVNDSYIIERLYCAVYGAILLIEDVSIIANISLVVYELFFKDKEPYPNILARDYARGIIEKAIQIDCLSKKVDINLVRHPYKSSFKLVDISQTELDQIVDKIDEKYSSIKSSIMGFSGDFGNYIMDDVHKWTSTKLSEPKPLSQNELMEQFISSLDKEQVALYKAYYEHVMISEKSDSDLLKDLLKNKDIQEIIDSIDLDIEETESEEQEKHRDPYQTEEELKAQFTSTLEKSDAEYFRWLKGSGKGKEKISAFSRKMAQRWVLNRVFELGWEKKLFDEFDSQYAKRGRSSRNHKIERIGKKYQWIAYFELLSHLSDNYHFLGDSYAEKQEVYKGPWQLWIRDIDPSMLLKGCHDDFPKFKQNNKLTWWRNYNFDLTEKSDDEKKCWLKDETNIPDLELIFRPKNDEDNKRWIVPHSFMTWDDDYATVVLRRSTWIKVDSYIVKNKDVKSILRKLHNQDLRNDATSSSSTRHQIFFKEVPWHESCNYEDVSLEDDWYYTNSIFGETKDISITYDWEGSREDSSIDKPITITMPSATLMNGLKLQPTKDYYNWYDESGNLVYFNPSFAYKKGASIPLVNEELFTKWLQENDLNVIWHITIEKSLYHKHDKYFGRQISTNICYYDKSYEINKKSWIRYEE